MAEVRLVDVSLRDGNQSLWGATGLRTEHILQIAPLMNRVGFRALDRLRGALDRCEIAGVATTRPALAALARDDEFVAGGVGTEYLARWLELQTGPVRDQSG